MHRNFFRSLSALAVSAALIGTAVAGPYPDKPITFVVPSAAVSYTHLTLPTILLV